MKKLENLNADQQGTHFQDILWDEKCTECIMLIYVLCHIHFLICIYTLRINLSGKENVGGRLFSRTLFYASKMRILTY